MEKATFGAGCFWGVEAAFRALNGVSDAIVGYEGGSLKNPTYEDVCSGRTGHAEVVEVTFDAQKISYDELLNVFFGSHNPTTPNRQGWDIGTQYRSAIFFHSPAQEELGRRAIERWNASGKLRSPIVTQIEAASQFYRAEEYHQRYLEKSGRASCHI